MALAKSILLATAAAAAKLRAAPLIERMETRRLGTRYVRAIAYHSVGKGFQEAFSRQVAFLADRYRCLDESGLGAFIAAIGDEIAPPPERPGLVITFDDGLLDNYQVAAPLLEEAGLRGWFFIPTGLPGLAGREAEAFCSAGALNLPVGRGERIAMSWDELRDLKRRGHVIGCHTATHRRMRGPLDETLLREEFADSRALAARELGAPPESFAWVGGEPDTYAAAAEKAAAAAGFRYAFTTQSAPFLPGDAPLRIHRTVLEPDLAFGLFRLKLAGLSDIAHRDGRAEAMARLDGSGTEEKHEK